jgi:hypothetical protein
VPKFYEIKALTAAGYISLVIFSLLGYLGGRILPLGLVFIILPFIVELVLSIYYIKISIENKRMHFLCLSIIILAIAVFTGIGMDINETINTKNYLTNLGNQIEEYKLKNGIEVLNESNIKDVDLPADVLIYFNNDGYSLRYKDASYISNTRQVLFRPRP